MCAIEKNLIRTLNNSEIALKLGDYEFPGTTQSKHMARMYCSRGHWTHCCQDTRANIQNEVRMAHWRFEALLIE